MAAASDPIVVTYRDRSIQFRAGLLVEPTLRANRFYEAQLLQYIEALALPGVYVDVGGYIGTHAIFFASFCPASGVHTFEPRPQCYESLRANVAANQLGDRVHIHPLGLSNREEVVTVTLEGREEAFQCRPLDDLVSGPVSLIKLDVEGMEEAVLAGAARILGESRPLLFIEAHTPDALGRDLALLAPYGYRATGRVFNASPTYELAADDSPTAPVDRLPVARSLLATELWTTDAEALQLSFSDHGLGLVSHLGAEQQAHLTQPPVNLRVPPSDDRLAVAPGRTHFLELRGDCYGATLFVMEYRGRERTVITRHFVTHQFFQRLDLRADTDRIRVCLRLKGPGALRVAHVALHG